ncbi:EAL domain-containing protein [Pseudanabaena sp. FACHB-2040]|uniref:two-component system response regulator n=1 Tax=Pseudanabaena sp. FACHB-2040 TaxID=2692859 RepID=UPI0016859726|nr:EAL domain-containing protein [Pseudanabaena sp. FACHB-2040]MBD2261037.1 EAL domain-containing protein [Pseudanabaena sp. FACHB-2040]
MSAPAEATSITSAKVLIVDDTPTNLRLLSNTLIQQGYDVQCAISGELALIGVRASKPDIILLDITMPQMDGFEVCRQLKAESTTQNIPVIFLSALDDSFDKVRAFQAGGIDYITKPFQVEEVVARVANHLALQRAQTAILSLNTELEQRVEERTQSLQQLNLELQASEERFRTVANAAPVLIWMVGIDASCQFVNQHWLNFTGCSFTEVLNRGWVSRIHPAERSQYEQLYQTTLEQHQPFTLEYRLLNANSEYRWILETSVPLYEGDECVGFIGSGIDIHDRRQAEEQLIHNALHDSLTDLPNRVLLMERLELSLNRMGRSSSLHFAVLFLDLDRFKLINDGLGHLAGDCLLVQFASRLERVIRPTDLLARLGGDEFVLLLEDINGLQDAVHIANRILEELRSPFTIAGQEVFLTASIGIVLNAPHYYQGTELLRDADTAMYEAKKRGKARYEIFNSEMHQVALKQLHLENDLRKALEQQQFVIHYQPIVDLHTGELVGLEALVRWQPPQGMVLPNEFIPVAEETGLIIPLGEWVLRTACYRVKQWQEQFPRVSLRLSVNLSAKQLQEPTFLTQVDRVLQATGLSGHHLTLEITESMLIENVENVIAILQQLRDRQIQIDIDDFGTGYSSLSYLHRFPIHALKIDQSFTQTVDVNPNIVEAIISLGHALGLDVVAEGIGTAEQQSTIRSLGCRYGQGYYLGRPLSTNEMDRFLSTQTQLP